jgi:hypothetical protein
VCPSGSHVIKAAAGCQGGRERGGRESLLQPVPPPPASARRTDEDELQAPGRGRRGAGGGDDGVAADGLLPWKAVSHGLSAVVSAAKEDIARH